MSSFPESIAPCYQPGVISVALCTYNGGKHLREQLQSLAAQTLVPDEVQVGDDQSTDDTLEILRNFSAPFPVRVTVNKMRLGYGENFIQTARRCSSDWIAFCDQDDVWGPKKLERCAAEFRPGVQLVAHDVDADAPYGAEPFNPKLSLVPRWYCLGFCQVFRRELLDYPHHRLPWAEVPDAHDIWIPFLAGMTGEIVCIKETLAHYRQHDNNVSKSLGKTELIGEVEAMLAATHIADELGLKEASDHYRRWANRLIARQAVRQDRSLSAFFKLLVGGAYRSGGYQYFGKRGLIQDARAMIHG